MYDDDYDATGPRSDIWLPLSCQHPQIIPTPSIIQCADEGGADVTKHEHLGVGGTREGDGCYSDGVDGVRLYLG